MMELYFMNMESPKHEKHHLKKNMIGSLLPSDGYAY